MGTKRESRNYTDEFKRDAVALVTEQGYSALIHKWRTDLQDQDMDKTLRVYSLACHNLMLKKVLRTVRFLKKM